MSGAEREDLDFMFDEELEQMGKKHYFSHVDNW